MKKIIGIGLMLALVIPLLGQNLIDINLRQLSSVYHKYFYMAFLDNIERMLFITNDGKMLVISGITHKVGVNGGILKLASLLKQSGKAISDLIIVIHNHNTEISFSSADKRVYRNLQNAGFIGQFQIYWPYPPTILTLNIDK